MTHAVQDSIENLMNQLANETNDRQLVSNMIGNFIYLIRHMKPYEGQLIRHGETLERLVRFYDEREWRYVPNTGVLKENDVPHALTLEAYKNQEVCQQANAQVATLFPLQFEPNGIRYIIVNKEEEVFPMTTKIQEIKAEKFIAKDVEVLKTRVLSVEHIRDDF